GAERTALTEQISAIAAAAVSQAPADRRDQTAADCGQRLATELGRRIVAAQPTDLEAPGSVLIVVDTDTVGEVQGWVLPSCDALRGDALSQLTVRLD
ncbi:MAG: hypothetical protein ICV70_05595, partial [Jiangellaceae bacterium]|nr:hypothetical protein [Jiangellaceae bacterium]